MGYIGIRATGDSWGGREERKAELRRRLHQQDQALIRQGIDDPEGKFPTPHRHRGPKRIHTPKPSWEEYAHSQVAVGSVYFLRHHAPGCADSRCRQAMAAHRAEESLHQARTLARLQSGELERLLGSP